MPFLLPGFLGKPISLPKLPGLRILMGDADTDADKD